MRIIDWNPAKGDLCQGDVILVRIPDSIHISTEDEVSPDKDGQRLIIASGEVTGHHHAVWNPQPALFRDDGLARDLDIAAIKQCTERLHGGTHMSLTEAETKAATARLYRDPAAVDSLVALGELAHSRLAIGFLVVEGGPVVLRHDEHDTVRIPVGRYYVGNQAEYDAAELRRVAD